MFKYIMYMNTKSKLLLKRKIEKIFDKTIAFGEFNEEKAKGMLIELFNNSNKAFLIQFSLFLEEHKYCYFKNIEELIDKFIKNIDN